MKDVLFTIKSNEKIAKNTYEMVLLGDTEGIKAGAFVNLKLDGFFLRRPISVCEVEGNALTLIYKVVGNGTEKMSQMDSEDKGCITIWQKLYFKNYIISTVAKEGKIVVKVENMWSGEDSHPEVELAF